MKWKYYPLPVDDERGVEQIELNLRSGDRTFGKKLLARFSLPSGTKFAIALEGLDLDSLADFHYATYCGGKQWDEVEGSENLPLPDTTEDGLTSFVSEFLGNRRQGIVVVENPVSRRSDPNVSSDARERFDIRTRIAFFADEVYGILTPDNSNDGALINDTIREAWHRWFVAVCASPANISEDNELSEQFFDELVERAEHVIVPAFDCEGFIVWSPSL